MTRVQAEKLANRIHIYLAELEIYDMAVIITEENGSDDCDLQVVPKA